MSVRVEGYPCIQFKRLMLRTFAEGGVSNSIYRSIAELRNSMSGINEQCPMTVETLLLIGGTNNQMKDL